MQAAFKTGERPRSGSVAGLRPILDVLKEMNSERNLRRLITMILDTMIRFSNAHRGSIGVLKGEHFNAELSRDREGDIAHSELAALGVMLKTVSEREVALVVEDVRKVPEVQERFQEPGAHPCSILCLPLRVKSRLLGAIYLDNTQMTHAFGPRQREFAQILTDHAAIAIENALLHRHTTRDRTTGLSNHGHFEVQLESEIDRARRLGEPCALLMVDLDDFKGINDAHGHPAGTEVLRQVAQTLASSVRGMDLVGRGKEKAPEPVLGRYGGDEFEIVLPGTSREGALQAARRVLAAVKARDFSLSGRAIRVTLSIGIAVFPDDALDAPELQARADEALYESKRAGKGRAMLCRPQKPSRSRVQLPSWLEDY